MGWNMSATQLTIRRADEQDNPPFAALAEYATQIAAGTSTACRSLARGDADIAIHWDGGRHHALRNRASGFCYVADIVLAIMLLAKEGRVFDTPRIDLSSSQHPGEREPQDTLVEVPAPPPRPRRPRILYVDLDLHFGDGVHQAFLSPAHYPSASTSKPPRPPQVLTLSIHHASPLFFPRTPAADLPAADTPHPFSLSLPLAAYAQPSTYARVWGSVEAVREAFNPDYVVLQLGVDGFPGDRVGQVGAWGVEGEGGMRWCVEKVMGWGRPLCVLGGGGYDHANTGRAWAVATASLVSTDCVSRG